MQRAFAAAAPCRRPQSVRAWSLSHTPRCYATTTDPPRKAPPKSSSSSSPSSSQYANSPWRRPLASAQTLSLLSTSPRALLFALEQSLQGAIKAIEKTTPQGAKGKAGDQRDSFTLVFAVDKTLPSEVLGEATNLLRDVDMPHVGVLCDPLPEEWLPAAALGDSPSLSSSSSSSSPPQLLHLISLSLLPSTLVTPFTSSIPGAAPIKAGRWATGKAAFDDDQSRVGALSATGGGEEKDWRDLWGRENASNALPEALEGLRAEDVLATILVGSDDAPQGLLEGLDARHAAGPGSAGPLVGALASNTFFETGGRDRCMFFRGSSKAEKEVRDSGAVGLVFATKGQQQQQQAAAGGSGSKPSLETKTPWQRLEALPPQATSPKLRRITRAKGNIISLLSESTKSNDAEGRNACQCFLRDVAEGRSSSSSSSSPSTSTATSNRNPMSVEEQRSLSSHVTKDEDFWAAVYRSPADADAQGATPRPLLVSRILSGHPGRGTLSLETDLDLAEGKRSGGEVDPIATLGEEKEKEELWIQFFKQVPPSPRRKEQYTVIDVPGPDLGAWALPRFLFVSTTATSSSASSSSSQEVAAGTKEKARVHALPNVFLLPTSGVPSATAGGGADAADGGDGGAIMKREARVGAGAGAVGSGAKGEVRLSSELEKRTGMWRLPGTSVMLDLRGTTKGEE